MAERELSVGVLSAIEAGVIRPVIFIEVTYVSGDEDQYLRLFTGVGQLEWNGETWTGGRELLGISPAVETTNPQAVGFSITLSGMPAAYTSLALQSLRQGRPGKIWLGFFDSAGDLIPDPYPVRRGRFDIAPVRRSGETMTITANYVSRLIDLEKPRERRYTHEDQQMRLSGDRGFEQVPELQDAQDNWGG